MGSPPGVSRCCDTAVSWHGDPGVSWCGDPAFSLCRIPADPQYGGPPFLCNGYPFPQYDSYRCHTEYMAWVKRALEDNFERARQQLGLAAERQKRYSDVRTKDKSFKSGDFVLRIYPPNLENNLSSPYIGLYRVMAQLGEVTFSFQRRPNSKPFSVHVDQLKLYYTVDYLLFGQRSLIVYEMWHRNQGAMMVANRILSMIAVRLKLTRKPCQKLWFTITLLAMCGGANSWDVLKTTICIRSDNLYARCHYYFNNITCHAIISALSWTLPLFVLIEV